MPSPDLLRRAHARGVKHLRALVEQDVDNGTVGTSTDCYIAFLEACLADAETTLREIHKCGSAKAARARAGQALTRIWGEP